VIKLFFGLGIGRDDAGACASVVTVGHLLLLEWKRPN